MSTPKDKPSLFKRIIKNEILMQALIAILWSRKFLAFAALAFATIAGLTATKVDDNICNLQEDCRLELKNQVTGETETVAVVKPVTTVSDTAPVIEVAPVASVDTSATAPTVVEGTPIPAVSTQ